MINLISLIKNIDLLFCQYFSIVSPEKPALIVFNFHKIFKDKSNISLSGVDPQQGTTLNDFKLFIEYFLSAKYTFVHPDNIPDKLDSTKKYILITFDDGYYNNSYVLPLITEYKIPSIFFIASNNVLNNEAFWWDVIYSLKEKGISPKKIATYKRMIKAKNPNQVKKFLKLNVSNEIFQPRNEYDRPFNIEELKEFSKEQYVIIGNHTADHAILTNCSTEEVQNQIQKAQNDLTNITGKLPRYISYPNGNFSNKVINAMQGLNLRLAFTMVRAKNFPPFEEGANLFKIHRFMYPRECNIEKDGLLFRSNISLYNSGINFYNKLNNIQAKWLKRK